MISIIVPVLNEATTISKLLEHLGENLSGDNAVEVIVVDGGSDDETKEIIQEISGRASVQKNHFGGMLGPFSIKIISSEKGRARQMNLGANNAKGDILYFLHADSLPPQNFDQYIKTEVKNGNPAGCFQMKFDSNHWWLRLAGWLTKFSWRACRGGDQSQFITKSLFEEIGGFNESFTIYEDNILINELYARKKFVVIPHCLVTSARLYKEKGIWNLQYHFWAIYIKRWLGADADELYRYYSKYIKTSKNTVQLSQEKPQEVFSDK